MPQVLLPDVWPRSLQGAARCVAVCPLELGGWCGCRAPLPDVWLCALGVALELGRWHRCVVVCTFELGRWRWRALQGAGAGSLGAGAAAWRRCCVRLEAWMLAPLQVRG